MHQFGQAARDRQPQAGAAVLAGGRPIALLEALEQPFLLFCGEPDAGVGHRETQHLRGAGVAVDGDGFDDIDRDANLAPFGELDRVVAVVDQDLPQAQGIADEHFGNVGGDVEDQFDPLLVRLFADQVDEVVEHVGQLELGRLDAQLAGLDFREIENVVDDAEQVLARLQHLADVVALPRRQFGLEQQMAHAVDRVHRRADLMAHARQELGLGSRRRLGQGLGLDDREFRRLGRRDVGQAADHARRRSVRPTLDDRPAVEHPPLRPVGVSDTVLAAIAAVTR
jgi:hypothetical protein